MMPFPPGCVPPICEREEGTDLAERSKRHQNRKAPVFVICGSGTFLHRNVSPVLDSGGVIGVSLLHKTQKPMTGHQ